MAATPSQLFVASRWTAGNHLFPAEVEVTDTAVIRRRRTFFHRREESTHPRRVASVRIETGIIWADLVIESTGRAIPSPATATAARTPNASAIW